MELHCIAQQVLDVAATNSEIAYVKRDTKADGSVFVSFHFVDWETLACRKISQGVYLQMKFGDMGPYVADALDEPFSCRAAMLPDGGCAVLHADAMVSLFRPDGSKSSSQFFLGYRDAPAYDIASHGNGLWFTAPARNAIALYSLGSRAIELRIGGPNLFNRPVGIALTGNALMVSCVGGSGEVVPLFLPSYDLGDAIELMAPCEKYFTVFGRAFLWMGNELHAVKKS